MQLFAHLQNAPHDSRLFEMALIAQHDGEIHRIERARMGFAVLGIFNASATRSRSSASDSRSWLRATMLRLCSVEDISVGPAEARRNARARSRIGRASSKRSRPSSTMPSVLSTSPLILSESPLASAYATAARAAASAAASSFLKSSDCAMRPAAGRAPGALRCGIDLLGAAEQVERFGLQPEVVVDRAQHDQHAPVQRRLVDQRHADFLAPALEQFASGDVGVGAGFRIGMLEYRHHEIGYFLTHGGFAQCRVFGLQRAIALVGEPPAEQAHQYDETRSADESRPLPAQQPQCAIAPAIGTGDQRPMREVAIDVLCQQFGRGVALRRIGCRGTAHDAIQITRQLAGPAHAVAPRARARRMRRYLGAGGDGFRRRRQQFGQKHAEL